MNEAYSSCHKIITDCYNKCFATVKLSHKHVKDKIWVTQGIKKVVTIKINCIKNGYVVITLLTKRNTEVTSKYSRKLHWLLRRHTIEKKIDRQINSIKQLWTNVNKISLLCKEKNCNKNRKINSQQQGNY